MKRGNRMPSSLIVVGVTVAIGLVAALTVPLAASTLPAPTSDRLVRERVLILQGYIERYAVAHELVYPARSVVRYGGGLQAPLWPYNPFTRVRMAPGTSRGTYTYTVAPDGSGYTLTGHLSSGSFKVYGAAPGWLAAMKSEWAQTTLALKDDTVKRNVEIISSFVKKWAVLHNGTAPLADDVEADGALGQSEDYWPVDPYTGLPVTQGSSAGCVSYAVNQDGTYSLAGHLGTPGAADYSVTAPIPPAVGVGLKDEYVKQAIERLRLGIEIYAIQNAGMLPAAGEMSAAGAVGQLVDNWPRNPWTAVFMTDSAAKGDFSYAVSGGGSSYTLEGHLSDGSEYASSGIPPLSEMVLTAYHNFKDQSAKIGVQVIKDYVEEWKLTHGGTLPTADELTQSGAVGAAQTYWPPNPWAWPAGMDQGTGYGQYEYEPSLDGTFSLLVHLMPTAQHPATYTAQ